MKTLIMTLLLFSSIFSANALNFININQLNDISGTYIDVRSIYARERDVRFHKQAIWVDPHSIMDINDFLVQNQHNKQHNFIIYCSCPNEEYAIAMAEIMEREGFTHVYILKGGWDDFVESSYFSQEGETL